MTWRQTGVNPALIGCQSDKALFTPPVEAPFPAENRSAEMEA
jgi:hypothetical protein